MRWKKAALLIGDILLLYGALFLALEIRYRLNPSPELVAAHIAAFSGLFFVWILVFYASRLYDIVGMATLTEFMRIAMPTFLLNLALGAVYFYVFARGPGAILPRGTLFLFFLIFAAVFTLWRRAAGRILSLQPKERVAIIGKTNEAEELAAFLNNRPERGYRVIFMAPEEDFDIGIVRRLIEDENVTTVVASEHAMRNIGPHLAELANSDTNFFNLATFYEMLLEKIPLSLVEETWFLENIIRRESKLATLIGTVMNSVASGIFILITLPIWLIIALAIKINSPGPVFYTQTRVGLGGKNFRLFKFRTMRRDAEKDGAQWALANDPRVTSFGRILRKTNLDELPQLLNILCGEMSFVGPRPERPEFEAELKKQIPFYTLRHLVKPGLTGWAQLNFRYGASIEDAREKLQYDLFYIKNRSIPLNISIILKTLNIILRGGTGR